jgi:hypothetical protein
MSWELVAITSVMVICSTIVVVVNAIWGQRKPEVSKAEVAELRLAVQNMQTDYLAVHKLAEETKKLLSNTNLAQGLGATRR